MGMIFGLQSKDERKRDLQSDSLGDPPVSVSKLFPYTPEYPKIFLDFPWLMLYVVF
jgi:hypothetical protein